MVMNPIPTSVILWVFSLRTSVMITKHKMTQLVLFIQIFILPQDFQFRWCQSVEKKKTNYITYNYWVITAVPVCLASVVPLNASQTFRLFKNLHHLHRIHNVWKQIQQLCWTEIAFKTEKLRVRGLETHLVCNIQRIIIWCKTNVRLLLTVRPEHGPEEKYH